MQLNKKLDSKYIFIIYIFYYCYFINFYTVNKTKNNCDLSISIYFFIFLYSILIKFNVKCI